MKTIVEPVPIDNKLIPVHSVEELKAVFLEYGFKDNRIFIARETGQFFETLINSRDQAFLDDNILCIYEVNYAVDAEKLICMTSLGLQPSIIKASRYIVQVKFFEGEHIFRRLTLASENYGVSPFAGFISTISLKHKKTCTICTNKKKSNFSSFKNVHNLLYQ